MASVTLILHCVCITSIKGYQGLTETNLLGLKSMTGLMTMTKDKKKNSCRYVLPMLFAEKNVVPLL